MEKNRLWELLAKLKAGEATPEEQLEINQHLAAFPDDTGLLSLIDAFWDIPLPVKSAPAEEEITVAWNGLRKKMSPGKQLSPRRAAGGKIRSMTKRIAGIAAVLLLSAGGWWFWNAGRTQAPTQKNTVSTKNGSKSKIGMPDGTQVWLNVGSRIYYDEKYGIENREITLAGEAYFDVVHDEKKPFIIHTPAMTVKVLGTVFNVKAYPGDETTEASLIRGSIEVTFPGRPREKLILKPNDKISIVNGEENALRPGREDTRDRPGIMVSKVNYQPADSAIIETAWVNNKLIFRKKPFEELSKDMERWFNVAIQVHDSAMLNQQFTGTFSDEKITDALDALSLSYPFQFRFNKSNNTVTIYRK